MSGYKELMDKTVELMKNGNINEALSELKIKETNLDKDAVAILAQLYLLGIGVATDVQKGIELYNKAIKLGSSEAMWELGILYYENSMGIPVNKVKAAELFQKGADGGNIDCCGAISECYLKGEGVNFDAAKAFKYSMIAAKAGNSMGIINTAICYDDGIGVYSNKKEACFWYKKILDIEPENDFAMLRISVCLADPFGEFGTTATYEMLKEAFYYAAKAVEKGNILAHIIIGWFYEKGEIVPKDFDMAHKYIKIAANKGNEYAKEHIKNFRKDVYGNYYIKEY